MRPILAHERPLVEALFEFAGLVGPDDSVVVEEMSDGSMGSLAFIPLGRQYGATASECQFTDSDGVLVVAALNLDEHGEPLEIDVWKVDFSALDRWPLREHLTRLATEGNLRPH